MVKWEVVEELEGGGQGSIYLVKSIFPPYEEAILKKISYNQNQKKYRRGMREIKILKLLKERENIIQIFDFFEENNALHIIMEKADMNLKEYLQKNEDLKIEDKFKLFDQIINGIRIAHSQELPIIHRDLKPENVLLKNGIIKIADFGISYIKLSERLTSQSEKVGPRFYCWPELEKGKAKDVLIQTDYYSLGKLLYFILTNGKKDLFREEYEKEEYNLVNMFKKKDYELFNAFFFKTINLNSIKMFQNFNDLIEGYNDIKKKLLDEQYILKNFDMSVFFTYLNHQTAWKKFGPYKIRDIISNGTELIVKKTRSISKFNKFGFYHVSHIVSKLSFLDYINNPNDFEWMATEPFPDIGLGMSVILGTPWNFITAIKSPYAIYQIYFKDGYRIYTPNIHAKEWKKFNKEEKYLKNRWLTFLNKNGNRKYLAQGIPDHYYFYRLNRFAGYFSRGIQMKLIRVLNPECIERIELLDASETIGFGGPSILPEGYDKLGSIQFDSKIFDLREK